MKISTKRLDTTTETLYNLLTDASRELRVRWSGDLESNFIRQYKHYEEYSEIWNGNRTLLIDPYALESEIQENFLSSDDIQKANYTKLLIRKISPLHREMETIDELQSILKTDIKSGLVNKNELIDDSWNGYSYISSFVYRVDCLLEHVRKIKNIIEENIDTFYAAHIPISPQQTQLCVNLQWKGDKTDLAELVWALAKSGRINDTATGQLITLKELTHQFEAMFGLTLDVVGLMKGRMKTYKVTSDGNVFTKSLFDLVNERVANS